ncbi:MAG: aminoglycoside phosphotransferase family protein [Dehalococcoidia bacterium]
MDERGDFTNYEIDGHVVIRVPRDDTSARCLGIERELLPRLAPLLPVAIPVFEYVHEPDERFPYGVAAYRKVEGLSGETHRPVGADRACCAETLGRALSILHAFPLADARACGVVPHAAPPASELRRRIEGYADLIRREAPALLTDEVERYLLGEVEPPRPSTLPEVLLHHDLKGEHYILTPKGDDLHGIIDWADAAIGDPATEFVGVALWLGMPFVEQVLAHYARPADDGFVDRVQFANQCARLIHLGMRFAGEWDAPLDLLVTQFRWAFGLAEPQTG